MNATDTMFPTRLQAAENGHRKFFTGRPCSRGHVAARYVTTGNCIECARVYASRFAAKTGPQPRLFSRLMHPDDHAAMNELANYLVQAREAAAVPPAPPAFVPPPVHQGNAKPSYLP